MGQHWPMVRGLVSVLTALLYGQDANGMDIYFTSSSERYGPFTEPVQFTNLINKMKAINRTSIIGEQGPRRSPTNDRADDIRESLGEILSLVATPSKQRTNKHYTRKLTIIIFTDGCWDGITRKRTVAERIVSWIDQWEDEDHLHKMLENENRGLSIQFVQFGNDKEATIEFEYMDNELANIDGTPLP